MKSWKEFTHFAALDWAKDHHDVVVVNRQGTVVADFRIAHDCAGWQSFAEKLRRFEAVAVANRRDREDYSPDDRFPAALIKGLLLHAIHSVSADHSVSRRGSSYTCNLTKYSIDS